MGRPLVEVMHGVNFNLLELRNPSLYGGLSLRALEGRIRDYAAALGLDVAFMQTNSEQLYVEHLHRIARRVRGGGGAPHGLILNPGAWTHYAWAIHDALELVGLPVVEVHLSNPAAREGWRRLSVIRDLCLATVAGEGVEGYRTALEVLASGLRGKER